jgi:hypothetical protein
MALIVAVLLHTARSGATAQETEVFVLGALGSLHEREESFDFATLDRVIRRIAPDVVLLEVTPEELAGKVETRGRPEYPRVVWRMLGGDGAPRPFAMEAGQPLYGELTSDAAQLWNGFAKDRPTENAALTAYSNATTDVLVAHWKSPADTQDEATDALARARHTLRAALLPAGEAIQVRWDRVMVDVARKAIAEHPGTRVLVLGSYRNRFMFVEALRDLPGVKLVDSHDWMAANGFGRGATGGGREPSR